MSWLRTIDDRVFFWFNSAARHTGWLNHPGQLFAKYAVVLCGILILVALVQARSGSSRTLAAVGWTPIATLAALGLNQPLGHLFQEARPYTSHPGILVLANRSADFSFPSDHAVMAGAVAAGLWLANRKLGTIAWIVAILLAAARVYIAAHYPWDVVAGLAFGALVTWVGWQLLSRPLTSLTAWLRRLPGLDRLFPLTGSATV